MATIQFELVQNFRGEAVVLVSMDEEGVRALLAALIESSRVGVVNLPIKGGQAIICRHSGPTSMDMTRGEAIEWRLSSSKITEMTDFLQAMLDLPAACHNYVDIDSPTKSLVLSKNEYM